MPVYLLDEENLAFPPVHLANPEGLLAVGGDLSVPRLLSAYSSGVFPWYDDTSPILWWSTDPRCVLLPEHLHIPRSMKRILASGVFSFTVNSCFAAVIEACAQSPRPGQSSTWIIPEMQSAYIDLYKAGYAHSIEVWEDGRLAGGLYGVALGNIFFGESMFFARPNASKAAVIWWVEQLKSLGFVLIDCQQGTEHMFRFGAKYMPRADFVHILQKNVDFEPQTFVFET